jgi:hypothetical protein
VLGRAGNGARAGARHGEDDAEREQGTEKRKRPHERVVGSTSRVL